MKKRFDSIVKKCMHAFLKTVNLKSTKVLAGMIGSGKYWGHRCGTIGIGLEE